MLTLLLVFGFATNLLAKELTAGDGDQTYDGPVKIRKIKTASTLGMSVTVSGSASDDVYDTLPVVERQTGAGIHIKELVDGNSSIVCYKEWKSCTFKVAPERRKVEAAKIAAEAAQLAEEAARQAIENSNP